MSLNIVDAVIAAQISLLALLLLLKLLFELAFGRVSGIGKESQLGPGPPNVFLNFLPKVLVLEVAVP